MFLFNKIMFLEEPKIEQRIFTTQKFLCQTDIKEKSSAKCSHMYGQQVMYVYSYSKECESTEWKFPVLTFLTRLLSGGCGAEQGTNLLSCTAGVWSSDGHVFNLRCSHGTRGSAAQRGAAPAWRPPGPAAAFIVKIKDVFKRSDCILIIRFKQLTFRQLSISSNRRDHDGIGVLE